MANHKGIKVSAQQILPGQSRPPDSKVHGANMGLIWGRQDPDGPHVDPMNFAIWDLVESHRAVAYLSRGLPFHLTSF